VALPKGRLVDDTATLLEVAGWGLDTYAGGMRDYRMQSATFPKLQAKVFNERDVPVQVAVGNYDLGICGLDWVEELSVKYSRSALVKIRDLGYGRAIICLAANPAGGDLTVEQLRASADLTRIASEYPNLAEYLALRLRLRRFSVFPLWGAAEAYPPESATVALLSALSEQEVIGRGLTPISVMLKHSAFLIANTESWERKDLSRILASIDGLAPVGESPPSGATAAAGPPSAIWETGPDTVRLALPDGHQQAGAVELMEKAGIPIEGYPSANGNRRPTTSLDGVVIKVIRPQDMPLQVANGNFDLAVTGRDWLTDHLTVFPSSPACELLDLKSARVRIVAVVGQDVPADDSVSLRRLVAGREAPFRVASEYVNIADKYARDNHLGLYKIVPTWGATEAFLPEDADMLIENTETGSTIARHNLKIIDTLFESTGCLIGSSNGQSSPAKRRRIEGIIQKLRAAVEAD
jgi:ATP phosphoribosyltransferase